MTPDESHGLIIRSTFTHRSTPRCPRQLYLSHYISGLRGTVHHEAAGNKRSYGDAE